MMDKEEFMKLHPDGKHEALMLDSESNNSDYLYVECMYCGECKYLTEEDLR